MPGTENAAEETVQRLDFFRLSRPVQDRFVAASKGLGIPAPLLTMRLRVPPETLVWLGVAAVGLVALAVLYRIGLGDLDSTVAIHARNGFMLHAAFGATFMLGLARVGAILWQTASLPFRPGVYLFPVAVVDATRGVLRVRMLTGSVAIDPGPSAVGLRFPDGALVSFRTQKAEDSRHVAEVLTTSVGALAQATANQDKKAVAALYPLAVPSFVNPFAPTGPIEPKIRHFTRTSWAVGPLLGIGLGLLTFYGRNAASEQRMFESANRRNTPEVYKLYLARGGNRPIVTQVLLPRAELREAAGTGGLAAIESYAKAHPGSHIDTEIKAALRTALLAELDVTAKAGTVAALNEFAKQHPANLVEPELRRAIRAVYAKALGNYQRASAGNQAVNAFVERVLAYAEKTTPRVELRFVRKLGKSVDVADAAIKKSPFFMGNPSIPSQYFDDAHAKEREDESARRIIARFSAVFPADILKLEVGAPVTDGAQPAVTVPTLFVDTQVQLSGASFLSTNPRGVFVGLGMKFETSFRLPDDPKPLKWSTDVWRPPDTTIERGDKGREEVVYAAMAGDAYNKFTTRLLKEFFKGGE